MLASSRLLNAVMWIVTGSVIAACTVPTTSSGKLAGKEDDDTADKKTTDKKTTDKKTPVQTTPQSTPPPPSNAGNGPVKGAPVLSLVTPSSLQARSPATQVTIRGTGLSGGMVDIGGTRVSGTGDDTSLSFQMPADKLAAAGALSLTVVSGNVNSNSIALIVTSAAAATVSSVTPNTATARSSTTTASTLNIQIAGSGFTNTSKVTFNGTQLDTMFSSANTLSATIPGTLLRTAGTYNLTVTDNGQVSSPVTFTVTPDTTTGTGTTTTGRPCSDLNLQPGYCIASGTDAGTYCDANNRAYKDYTRCPYGTGAGAGYLTCDDAGVTGYGCVSTGQYAGLLCSNGYLYDNAACKAAYGSASTGAQCQVSCSTAGVQPTGCVSQGTYVGNYCAADGCVYNGTAYGCDVYRTGNNGVTGTVSCAGATCANYGVSTFQCASTSAGIAQCATDGCMYLGCN